MTSLLFALLGFFLKLNIFSYIYWPTVFFPFSIFSFGIYSSLSFLCSSSFHMINTDSFPKFFQLVTWLSTLLTIDFLLGITLSFYVVKLKNIIMFIAFGSELKHPQIIDVILNSLLVLATVVTFYTYYLTLMKFILV